MYSREILQVVCCLNARHLAICAEQSDLYLTLKLCHEIHPCWIYYLPSVREGDLSVLLRFVLEEQPLVSYLPTWKFMHSNSYN